MEYVNRSLETSSAKELAHSSLKMFLKITKLQSETFSNEPETQQYKMLCS